MTVFKSLAVEANPKVLWQQVSEGLTRMVAAQGESVLATSIEEEVLNFSGAEGCQFFVIDRVSKEIVFKSPSCISTQTITGIDIDGLLVWLDKKKCPLLIGDLEFLEWPLDKFYCGSDGSKLGVLFHQFVDERFCSIMFVIMKSRQNNLVGDKAEIVQTLTNHAGYLVTAFLQRSLASQKISHQNALYDVGKRISASLDLNEVLNLIIDALQSVVPYNAAGIFLLDDNTKTVVERTIRGYPANINTINLKIGQGISGAAAQTGKAIIVPDVLIDDRYVQHRPETKSEMAVPLLSGDRVIGVFNIENDRSNAYNEDSRFLLEAFASQASIAIENARLFDEARRNLSLTRELEVAGEIQRTLLTRNIPVVPGISVAVYSEPSREIGGDFYDLISFSEKQLGVAIGDVVGKGIPAALTMASLYTSFHEYANYYVYLPSYVIGYVNEVLFEVTSADRYATLFYGIANLADMTFIYCNAGHPPPLLCRETGEIVILDTGGMIAGSFKNATFDDGRIYLEKGDVLILYTDGLIERSTDRMESETFGQEKLEKALKECHLWTPERIKEHLIKLWNSYIGEEDQEDDVTLIVVKREI